MDEKGKVIIAYILGWIGGLIVLFGLKNNTKETNIHAAQSIIASAGYFILTGIYFILPFTIPFFTTALWVVLLLVIIFGIMKAYKNEAPELPVLGDLAKSLFKSKIGE